MMDTAHDAPEMILHPISRDLFRHWEAVRRENSAPRRLDLDLHQISHILSQVGILERDRLVQRYTWRLAGTGICGLFCNNVTGATFLDGWPAFEASIMSRMLDAVITGHQPGVARIHAFSATGHETGIEMTCLPLAGEDPAITHVLTAMAPFQSHTWFGEVPLKRFELTKLRMIRTEHFHNLAPGESGCEFEATGCEVPSRPALRVIEGGRSDN